MGEVGVQDLAAWLLACIEEDEQAAENCGGAPWVDQVPGMVHVDPVAIREAKWQFGQMGYVATVEHDYDRAHIARWNPRRVLVECDAKRRIIETMQLCPYCLAGKRCVPHDASAGAPTYRMFDDHDEHLLRLLALPYADRDGYREEWRP